MKKEPIIAIALGLFFGVSVGVGVLYAMNPPTSDLANDGDDTAVLPQNERTEITFEISEPDDGITIRNDRIAFKGSATADSLIIVQSAFAEEIVRTEGEQFEFEFPLAIGENTVNITFYPNESPNDYRERTLVIYSIPE